MQNQVLIFLSLVAASSLACDIKFPNNTETTFLWWQCNSNGGMDFYDAKPYDQSGNNYEYPIHLGKPIVVKTDMTANHEYTQPNLRNTISIWTWGAQCTWNSLPTFGLLKNLDACDNGVPCPVKSGRQNLNVVIDFTKFQTVVDMLKDNAPYQLQYTLHDKKSNDNGCVLVQARARIP